MTSEVKQLITDTIDLTGAAPPAIMEADAPVLTQTDGEIYLIGLVGGKDVGKSSLVNALVGRPITAATSFGPGTETVIAYAHESAIDELKDLLESEVSGRYSIVTHDVDRLRRQVLLDLPDIDSRFGDHVQITRRMLRHMLYPVWIQSIEKYADQRPQELLAAVAQGNDPANFVFCLNKADQLVKHEGAAAAAEVCQDYANRISKVLSIPAHRVYLISATHPNEFDLPELRELFAKEKSDSIVKQSRDLAQRRQDRSLLGWLNRQRLDERAQQIARLERDAEEMATSRIALPLLERAIPQLIDDPGQRLAMTSPATRLRLSRWPIVNAIDALFSPLLALVQKNLSASPTGSADPDAYLDAPGSISKMVQTTFAQLHQLDPPLGALYQDRKLWEPLHADRAAAELRLRFARTIEQQRQMILDRAAGRMHVVTAPLRWLLTIGAILWFPVIQPILAVMLQNNLWSFSRQTLLTIVNVLSVSHLLQCVTFLLLWFVVLWMLLRWSTQRRISRLLERWKIADADEELSLAGQTVQWLRELLEPIHQRRLRIEALLDRARKLDKQLATSSAA